MRSLADLRTPVCLLLVVSLGCPPAMAETQDPANANHDTTDVLLARDGLLTGQLYDAQGVPRADASVRLYDTRGNVVEAKTNQRGQFGYRGVSGGVYFLQADEKVQLARVWSADTAPPSARPGVVIVSDATTIRGQTEAPPQANAFVVRAKQVMANPFALGALVATAVAIPVAVHNSDSGS